MLRSLEVAGEGLEIETLVCDDPDDRGPSWSRNRGLERATGEVVFFADADDTVRPDFFRRLSGALGESQADFVLSSYDYAPLKRAYDLKGAAEVKEALLPAFFGYTFDDIRRWNAGGDLMARREQGSVWRAAFRREFLERNAIRFDETLRLFEDAAFLAACACFAERVVSVPEVLYDYTPGPDGILAHYRTDGSYWAYKTAALENRRALAARAGLDLVERFGGSMVMTALELMRNRRPEFRAYLRRPGVAEAFRRFPISLRHPLVAMSVLFARCAVLFNSPQI